MGPTSRGIRHACTGIGDAFVVKLSLCEVCAGKRSEVGGFSSGRWASLANVVAECLQDNQVHRLQSGHAAVRLLLDSSTNKINIWCSIIILALFDLPH